MESLADAASKLSISNLSDAEKLKRYKIFDSELQKINKKLTPPKSGDECKNNFNIFLRTFKTKLYEVEPFLKLYKLDSYQGSSYEGLSVGTSYKEFDINVHIKLDKNVVNPKDVKRSSQPGFVTMKMDIAENHAKNCPDRMKIYKCWIDKDNVIYPSKFYRWGEGVMTKVLNNSSQFECDDRTFSVKMKKSGPAFTLHVTNKESSIEFDVDIVFALSFDKWTLGEWDGNSWCVVSKMPKEQSADWDRSWRYAFPVLEKQVLNNFNHLKNVIRLIKQVRENSNMPYIASYFIKTLFMWEVKNTDSQYWNQSLGYLFVIMLYKLRDALSDKRINFYFDKRANLLDRCTDKQLEDGAIKLKLALQKIEKFCDEEPSKIETIFFTANKL